MWKEFHDDEEEEEDDHDDDRFDGIVCLFDDRLDFWLYERWGGKKKEKLVGFDDWFASFGSKFFLLLLVLLLALLLLLTVRYL